MLTRLEHCLLSRTIDDIEPLHILYKDARRDFKELTFTSFIEALVKLYNLGYVEAIIENIGKPEKEMSKDDLLEHYHGDLTEKEINIYPDVTEYYFKATPEGRLEEAKDIYDQYYPD